ncbi:jg8474 [Pararge aegeria aegeria]|uniref:Jg8474 protein n=1 Tax=Pararge aegeria aegeria TaxID=348720 RepID=A0A8S4RYI4_9NEOP|nr:jg8474 [Pararge aegeria aegeria]
MQGISKWVFAIPADIVVFKWITIIINLGQLRLFQRSAQGPHPSSPIHIPSLSLCRYIVLKGVPHYACLFGVSTLELSLSNGLPIAILTC